MAKWRREMESTPDPEISERVWKRDNGDWVYRAFLKGHMIGMRYQYILGTGEAPEGLAMVRRRCAKALKKQLPTGTCKECGQKIWPTILTEAQSEKMARLLG